jgi:hypothetical protein
MLLRRQRDRAVRCAVSTEAIAGSVRLAVLKGMPGSLEGAAAAMMIGLAFRWGAQGRRSLADRLRAWWCVG